MQRESIANTLLTSIVLCVGCSLIVSSAAVGLRSQQLENKVLDEQKNIIAAAGLSENPQKLSTSEVAEIFKQVEKKLIDLETGEVVTNPPQTGAGYDPRKAAKTEELSEPVTGPFNIGFSRREKYAWVYELRDEQGNLKQVVLPVYGKGLWSTLFGYIAVKADLETVQGLTFYQHGETPGLGGEVDNPAWKQKWVGKKIWEPSGESVSRTDDHLRIGVAKGAPAPSSAPYMVDGLSGATITSRGVDVLLKYWLSQEGFGKYVQRLASQIGAAHGNANS